MKKRFLPIILLTACLSVQAQEKLTTLFGNKQLKESFSTSRFQQKSGNDSLVQKSLLLPFIEDFSYCSPYADASRWKDSSAYVNRSFCFKAPSWGCVTLDALDAHGRIYAHASTSPFTADTLTSKEIRLDSVFSPIARSLTPADSIYFSFFYQPGGGLRNYPWEGLGDAPESGDSLILEFGYYTGDSMQTEWKKVWSAGGSDLENFIKTHHLDTSLCFHQIMIPVTDSCFFNRGFQFRFRNLASLEYSPENPTWAGNVDFWNIDYIRLDRGRTCKDTFIDDITIAANPGGILQNYQAMPWRQFSAQELKSGFELNLLNLSNVTKNASYKYIITDDKGQTISSYDGGAYNISYFRQGGFQSYAPHARPSISNVNLNLTAPADIYITHLHHEAGAGDQRPANDTSVFIQHFDNYFAYDDGTPEAGYTVVDVNSKNTALAVKFTLNSPDTLRAVAMYINHAFNDANAFDFNLCVWECKDDMPGELLYNSKVSQNFKEEIFGFQMFELEEPLALNGNFFVGYAISGGDFLNIGFDQNSDHSAEIRYFTSSSWNRSFLVGTPMIRPYVGDALPVSIVQSGYNQLKIYPNPTNSQINICLPEDNSNAQMQILSSIGQVMYTGACKQQIDISDYPQGIYIIRIQNGKQNHIGKVIKQ